MGFEKRFEKKCAMDKRKRIGLLFSHDENWIAGSYYVINLVNSLKLLPDERKPELVVFSAAEKDFEMIKETGYPYLVSQSMNVKYTLCERVVNKGHRFIFGKNIIEKMPKSNTVSAVFPLRYDIPYLALMPRSKIIYWIPDFQDLHLPEFFSSEDLKWRRANWSILAENARTVIFSSQNALSDFKRFYSDAKSETHVLNFSVTHPEYQHLDLFELLKKHNLKQPFFFAPNQFWKHKNHLVILKALKLLKDREIPCIVAFSGKETDYRNPEYFQSLKKFINAHQLEGSIKFLGFLERKEQLKLMREAHAVIQPSLFEGWSTVVEDCKAMNQWVVLSDLEVHREQIQTNVSFFDPKNEWELAVKIEEVLNNPPLRKVADYDTAKFGREFLEIVDAL